MCTNSEYHGTPTMTLSEESFDSDSTVRVKFRLSSQRARIYRYCSTVCSPIFTALWHWGARILRNFDLLTRTRARTGHNMSIATAPCARAPWGAMRAPGSRCIFTVLAISAMRGPQNGWLAGIHFSEFMHIIATLYIDCYEYLRTPLSSYTTCRSL